MVKVKNNKVKKKEKRKNVHDYTNIPRDVQRLNDLIQLRNEYERILRIGRLRGPFLAQTQNDLQRVNAEIEQLRSRLRPLLYNNHSSKQI